MAEVASMSGMAARAERNRAHNQMVWRKLAFFTALMFALPIGTFYFVKRLMGPGATAAYDNTNADMWSGFAAVLMVNIVIGLYILSAFMENDEKEVAPPVGRFATANKSKKDE